MAIELCSSLLAGVFCVAAPPANIPVRLSGFDDCYAGRQRDGTFQVRWNRDEYPWIERAEYCCALWRTRIANDDPAWDGLELTLNPSPTLGEQDATGSKHIVKTCAQWFELVQKGAYAYTTYDMCMESYLVALDGILSSLAVAVPARQTAFADLDLQTIAHELLPPTVERDEVRRSEVDAAKLSITGNRMWSRDSALFSWIEPVAFGDLDGDGWEDILACSGGGATEGTMRGYGFQALTRRDGGALIDISARLPDGMPSALDRDRDVAQWRANFNLPVDRELRLSGRCKCGGAEHGLSMTLSANGGFLSGSYRCDRRPKWLPIKGCLGKATGSIDEFGIDEYATATLYFKWHLANGVLSLKGERCGSGHIETDDFTAECRVASPSQRMIEEKCESEVQFFLGLSPMTLRRGCESDLLGNRKSVLCVGSGDDAIELIRMDTIDATAAFGQEVREATHEDAEAKLSHSLFRVDHDCTMAIFTATASSQSRAKEGAVSLIVIPVRDGRVSAHEIRVFDDATLVSECGDARIATGAVVWQWAGRGWVDVKKPVKEEREVEIDFEVDATLIPSLEESAS